MKPAPFEYSRPSTVAEAVEALDAAESGRVLAGGQSLIPAMNFRLTDVSVLVDIGRIEGLGTVTCDPGGVTVGAAATQTRVLDDDGAASVVPGLRAALRHVGHLQIRNRGTVCGSPAHADPAAELPALAVAADAVIGVAGPDGERQIKAGDFFVGPFWTALEDTEIVTEVRFPAPPAGSVTIVDEVSRRGGRGSGRESSTERIGRQGGPMTIIESLSEVDVEVTINGQSRRHRVPARLLLSDYIRDIVGLTGTHVGCEHGYCGACTVMVDGDAVRSCLMLAVQADGAEVRTVENLAGAGPDSLSPMQQAFHDNHALQCGFCTAGFLMTLESVDPDEWREPERTIELLSGNLCRCTGYQNIVTAVQKAWGAYHGGGGSDDG